MPTMHVPADGVAIGVTVTDQNKQIAAYLTKALKDADALDNWHEYREGYNDLRLAVREVVNILDPQGS